MLRLLNDMSNGAMLFLFRFVFVLLSDSLNCLFFPAVSCYLYPASLFLFIFLFPTPDPRLFYAMLGSSLLRRPEVVTRMTLEQLSATRMDSLIGCL
jgi:hypothetical protein